MRGTMTTLLLSAGLALGTVALQAGPQDGARLAPWQTDGSPVFFDGDYYCPAGATIYYDPKTMVISGTFDGVPIYVDTTIEPNSIVYAPIGGNQLRPYERPRVGDKAGTTGSRAPSFPVALSAERDRVRQPSDALAACGQLIQQVDYFPSRNIEAPKPESLSEELTEGDSLAPDSPRATVRSAALPQSNDGIWIEFEGARWAVSGASLEFDNARYTQVGVYRGSPVYRHTSGDASWELFVRPSPRGRLTRFVKIDR